MSNWSSVNSQSDIDYLMKSFGGFHDSCIIELHYMSGADISEDLSMGFGEALDRKLHIILKRQWTPTKIELLFEGMRQMNIAGWQNHYFSEISNCYLAFHNDLIKGRDDQLIVWSDTYGFHPNELSERKILAEPMVTYVIAERLKWRYPDV